MRPFTTLGRWLGVLALVATFAVPAHAQRKVTLRMNSATMPDTVAAGPAAGVQVRGQVASGTALPGGGTIDWNDNTTVRPTNVGGDYWTVDFQIPDNEQLNFKFYISQSENPAGETSLPGGWEDNAATDNNNYQIAAGTGDVVRDLHYFNKAGSQPYDWRPFAEGGSDSVAVWFRVYMDTEQAANKGLDLDDGNLTVAVRGDNSNAGSQNGTTTIDWGASNVVLNRERNDPGTPGYALFSGRVAFPDTSAGNAQAYKFYFSDSNTNDGWEDTAAGGDRRITIPAQDSTLHWVFYGDSPASTGTLVNGTVTFQADVSPLTRLGLFQTADDFAQVRGSFNGFACADDNDNCRLSQTPGTTQYVNQVAIRGVPGSTLQYKYYISLNNADGTPFFVNADGTENVNAGFEEPLDYGGGNRTFTFDGTNQSLPQEFFNGVRAGNLIAADRSIDVTFRVDMTKSLTFAGTEEGTPFNPATDAVTVQFEDSFWLLAQGLTPGTDDLIDTGNGGNLIPGFTLTDPDGDMVYTGTLKVDGPTYNGIGYRYVLRNGDNFRVEGGGGFEEGRRRYRYTDRTVSAFTFALDAFRPAGGPDRFTPWESNPTGPFVASSDRFRYDIAQGATDPYALATPNEGGPETAAALSLGNVFPNPTAGSASVVLNGRAGSRVTVRVYDVTGRMVGVVAEDVAASGQTLSIDTRGLAAGMYLVRADSDAGVATARMTVAR